MRQLSGVEEDLGQIRQRVFRRRKLSRCPANAEIAISISVIARPFTAPNTGYEPADMREPTRQSDIMDLGGSARGVVDLR